MRIYSMIKVDINKCVGCSTCEMVCSYHHKRCFNPIFSSIKVNFEDNYDINVNILDTCDCEDKEEPLCVRLCPTNAIKLIK